MGQAIQNAHGFSGPWQSAAEFRAGFYRRPEPHALTGPNRCGLICVGPYAIIARHGSVLFLSQERSG